ncbi:unnamed protein product [Eruca vesicaria subsp. sativa]|uniref:Uncharacterized protein n=1 Tax=Eruca vesicaria subsp. sativa TaxID=29727 RepID=A0ABC8JIS9_ERUVS|nr:unnamed protein product [Eruca vesicaria subsp. sativa]
MCVTRIMAKGKECEIHRVDEWSSRKRIASFSLYEVRSQLGLREDRVYAVLHGLSGAGYRFYILQRKLNGGNRLVVVSSLPPLDSSSSCVSVGSKLYVFNELNVLSRDCRSHKYQSIPRKPLNMMDKVANVIDGKFT